MSRMEKVFVTSVASVYPHYVAKVERRGRSSEDLDEAICWLTGFDRAELHRHLDACTSFEDFFAAARLNPAAGSITGVVCGVRVEEIVDPLERKIRYLDKIADEIARGKAMSKVMRRTA